MSGISPAARTIGDMLAAKLFDARSRGQGLRNVEVHLSEVELALAIAAGAQLAMETTARVRS